MAVIPIFVSSTFRDFHAERDELIATVLPAVNDRAAELGCRAEIIDLRWGVAAGDDDERHTRVLEVCLKEIERARPLFVGLLGDRYGWIPDDFRLANAAREAGISDYTFGISATALEFEHGALRHTGADAVFLQREVVGESPTGWSDDDPTRSNALKARVREHFEVHGYRVAYEGSRPRNLAEFIECATRVIGDRVVARAREIAGTQGDPVSAAESLFFDDRLRGFDGRAGLVRETVRRITSGQGVCLLGASGVGKSSIWCASVKGLRGDGLRVVAVPVGASPEVVTLRAVLLRVCAGLGVDAPQGLSVEDLQRYTRSALEAAAPVVLAIDGIDQLPDQARPTYLAGLPSSITALASTTSTDQARYVASVGIPTVEVPELMPTDCRQVVESMCTSIGRSLPEAAVERLVAEPRSPLWLRLAVGELSALDAEDFNSVNPDSDPLAEIARLVTATVHELPASTAGLLSRIVDRAASRFDEGGVGAVLALVGVSRSGLRPADLEALTGLNALSVAGIRRALSGLLAPRGEDGRLGFAHAVMREYATTRFVAPGAAAGLHRTLADHFLGHEDDPVCQQDRLWHLFRAGGESAAPVLNRVPADRRRGLAQVVLDCASVPDLSAALAGLDGGGIDFLAWVAHEYKAAIPSADRVALCMSLFEVARGLAAHQPNAEDLLRSVSNAAGCVADLPSVKGVEQRQRKQAESAWNFARQLVASHPDSVDSREVRGLVSMWFAREVAGSAESLEARRDAVADWRWVSERAPSLRADTWLQFALTEYGNAELGAGNLDAAREAYEQALPLTRRLLDDDPNNVGLMVNVINALNGQASVASAEGRSAAMLTLCGEAAQLAHKRYTIDPSRGAVEQFAITSRVYGMALFDAQYLPESRDWLDLADRLFRMMVQHDPHNTHGLFGTDTAGRAAVADVVLGDAERARARLAGVLDLARDRQEALGILTQTLEEAARNKNKPEDAGVAVALTDEIVRLLRASDAELTHFHREMWASTLEVQTNARIHQGGRDAAEASLREAIAIRRNVLSETLARGRIDQVRRLGVDLIQLASFHDGARRGEIAHEVATLWTEHLADDHGDNAVDTEWLAKNLSTLAYRCRADARPLLLAAVRYARAFADANPYDDGALVPSIGVTDTSGVIAAAGGDFESAARLWIAAAEMAFSQTTNTRLLALQRSVAKNLRRVSGESGLDPGLAAVCSDWAERLAGSG